MSCSVIDDWFVTSRQEAMHWMQASASGFAPALCGLRGAPFGSPALLDPQVAGPRVPTVQYLTAGGLPVHQPMHVNEEDVLTLDCDWIPQYQFDSYAALCTYMGARNIVPIVRYKPPGSAGWLSGDWLLVSTTEGWTEVTPYRWAGRVVLARQGSTY